MHFLKVVMHLDCKPVASVRLATRGISVGQGGTNKHRILKFVVGSFGLDSVLKKGGGVLGLRSRM